MVTRYLQATGGSSFFVTLPKDWVTRNKIKVKDPINISQTNNNSLVISGEHADQKQIELDVDKISNNHLSREIVASYVSGYKKIILTTNTYFNVEKRKVIREQLKLITGYELNEEGPKKLVIDNTSNNNTPLSVQVIKMLKSIISMYEDFEIAIKNKYVDLCEDIIERDDEIDKANLYVTKKFIESLNNFGINNEFTVPLTSIYFYQQQSTRLERIADHIVKISKEVVKSKTLELDEYNKKGLLTAEKYLKRIESLLITNDKNTAHKVLDGFIELKKQNDKKHSFDEFNTIVNNSLERIVNYCANIAEDHINIFR